jgi:hypothetical protein
MARTTRRAADAVTVEPLDGGLYRAVVAGDVEVFRADDTHAEALTIEVYVVEAGSGDKPVAFPVFPTATWRQEPTGTAVVLVDEHGVVCQGVLGAAVRTGWVVDGCPVGRRSGRAVAVPAARASDAARVEVAPWSRSGGERSPPTAERMEWIRVDLRGAEREEVSVTLQATPDGGHLWEESVTVAGIPRVVARTLLANPHYSD